MKLRLQFLSVLLCAFFTSFSQSHHIINVSGMSFNPDTLVCFVGDTVTINPGGYHNAVEVDDSTWTSNGTNSNGGFNIPLGTPSGSFVIDQVKTYYYVCTPHVALGMKGVIVSSSPAMIYGCIDTLACNFDASATIDDSSCTYSLSSINVNFSVNSWNNFVGDTINYFIDTFQMPTNGFIHFVVKCDDNNIDTVVWDYNDVTSNTYFVDNDFNPLTPDEFKIVFPYVYNQSSCGCLINDLNLGSIFDQYKINPIFISVCDTIPISLGLTQNLCFSGCTDSVAANFDSLATIDDGSCNYYLSNHDNLFFSEWGEGSSWNKYFEIYNPTSDTIDLSNYAFPSVSGNPNATGVYEYWNNFDSASFIPPNDIFLVAHYLADSLILQYADMTVASSTALGNGDDGIALIYGFQPNSTSPPSDTTYRIIDWIGDWNGDPGQGWSVSGVSAATRNHTIIRKCNISIGDTSWINSSANQWLVKSIDYWTNIGSHNYNNTIIDSQSYIICNGLSLVVGLNTYDSSGIYYDTLISDNGCDSVVVTDLSVLSASASIVSNNITICDGDSVFVGNNVYYNTGSYTDILLNSAGCDSIITTNLTVQTPTDKDLTICAGDSIVVGNSVYNSTGSYIDTIQSSIGCDSIVHTNLTIYSQFNSIYGGILNNIVGGGNFYSGQQSLELSCYMPSELVSAVIYSVDTMLTTFEIRDNNGNILDSVTDNIIPGGHRIYFNYNMSAGLDYELGVSGGSNDLFRHNSGVSYPYNFGSLAAVTSSSAGGNYYYFFYDIEVRQSSQPTNYSICDGESITIAGNIYDSTGNYVDTLVSSIGCDSLVFTNLVVYPTSSFTNNQTICNGETYSIGPNIYDSTGIYYDTLSTMYGCDSIVTTILIVDSIVGGSSFNNLTICLGDSVTVGTSTYFTSGTYLDTLTSSNGCDSIVTTTVTLFIITGINQQTICIGDSISVGNNIYYHAGVYSDTLVTSYGCDSMVTTYLNVVMANYNTINVGLPDTSSSPGEFSNYNGHLILDANVVSLLKSATVYSEDINVVTFELRDDNGTVLQDVTHTVYPGSQSISLNFLIPSGTDYQLGIGGGNSGLYRNNAGSGNSLAYPFGIGPVNITSSNAGNQYYYFYYDMEIMPINEQFICEGDSIVVGNNIYNIPGIYIDTFTSVNSCDSLVYTNLEYYPTTSLNINSSPSPAEICLGDTILLGASSGFAQYYWIYSNAIIGQNQNILLSPTEDTWYLLKAIDQYGCLVQEDIWVYVDTCFVGLDDPIIFNINIYPNPSFGIFNIEFNKVYDNNLNISIVNSSGNVVVSKDLKAGQRIKEFNLSEFSKGIYLIELRTEIGIYKKKIILK